MHPPNNFVISAITLLIANAVVAQRSSPQFGFPPPSSNQFSSDVFSSNSQDLGLSPPPTLVSLVGQQQGSSVQLQSASQSQQDQQSSSSQSQQVPSSQSVQQQQQSSSQQQQQPTIQLSRPSLSLSSLSGQQGGIMSRQSSQQQPGSSSSSSSSSQSSLVANNVSPQQHQSARQPSQSHSHQSQSHSQSQSSHRSQQNHPVVAQPVVHNHHNQHPSNLQPLQQTSQSLNRDNPAIIEAARKAEQTAASLAASSGQTYHCPDLFGFFRHHKSCDKYWACENGTATLKLCGNGLNFDDSDPKRENCAYPFSVDCGGDRTDLEPPISTPHCPRLYGLFADTANCRVFYSCWNGEASKYECPPGLAYDNEQRVCVWADLVDRCDQSEVSDGFVCPDPTEVDQPGHYTRHAHPTDCRKFYVCIEGVARPYGCSFGTVFNVDSLQCDEPDNVSGCEKYYGDIDPKTAKKLAKESSQGQSPVHSTSTSTSSRSSSQAQR